MFWLWLQRPHVLGQSLYIQSLSSFHICKTGTIPGPHITVRQQDSNEKTPKDRMTVHPCLPNLHSACLTSMLFLKSTQVSPPGPLLGLQVGFCSFRAHCAWCFPSLPTHTDGNWSLTCVLPLLHYKLPEGRLDSSSDHQHLAQSSCCEAVCHLVA